LYTLEFNTRKSRHEYLKSLAPCPCHDCQGELCEIYTICNHARCKRTRPADDELDGEADTMFAADLLPRRCIHCTKKK
ncbi:hypothetical protein PHLCEN_2v954, partial [Hermanssonia centrifuga]